MHHEFSVHGSGHGHGCRVGFGPKFLKSFSDVGCKHANGLIAAEITTAGANLLGLSKFDCLRAWFGGQFRNQFDPGTDAVSVWSSTLEPYSNARRRAGVAVKACNSIQVVHHHIEVAVIV